MSDFHVVNDDDREALIEDRIRYLVEEEVWSDFYTNLTSLELAIESKKFCNRATFFESISCRDIVLISTVMSAYTKMFLDEL